MRFDDMDNVPTILCEEREDFPEGLRFYCKYCKINHIHGRGNGHRIAHCTVSNSPYHETGYNLILNVKISDAYVVEYSPSQKQFHVTTLLDSILMNRQALRDSLLSSNIQKILILDYTILGIYSTLSDATDAVDSLKKQFLRG